MMRRLALLLLLAAPASAEAAVPTLVSRDVPLRGDRALASAAPRFTLVGLHWRGAGSVEFRTRSLSGRWSAWRSAAPEHEDGPDRLSAERSRLGWRVGNPYWTGPSDALQVRTRGRVARVRAHYVWSPAGRAPARALAAAGAPAIVPRLSWGANESIRRAGPSYAPSLRLAVVHHTAGTNGYSRAQSAAIVRGIQVYHVKGNGWNDVGYNFLVDKYGQVFEGRYGGMTRNVVGAHAEGFNTGSVGVAVLGTYAGGGITTAARDALVRLLAWRLDVAHLDPQTTLSVASHGNPRFGRGVPVHLRAVSGHRDTGFTSCPGDRLYAQLNAIGGEVAQTGLPKLYSPSVGGRIGGPVRFRGRLSMALPWTVRVTDAGGNVVGTGSGLGTAVDWTWDATNAAPGAYAWSIEAPDVLPATGTFGGRVVLSVSRVAAEPAVVSPNGDGWGDAARVSYTLGAPATVTATVVDAANATVAIPFSEARTAGEHTFPLALDGLPDGAYRLLITAVNGGGRQVAGATTVVVNRALAGVEASRAAFSPNADGRLDRIGFPFLLAEAAEVKVRVLRDGRWVATPFAGRLEAGPQTVEWDGRKRVGRLRDGGYEVEVTATTAVGPVSQRAPFASDTRRPSLRLLSAGRAVKLHVDEPAKVVVWLNGQRRAFERRSAGRLWIKAPRPLRALRAVAYDAAGNVSAPLRRR